MPGGNKERITKSVQLWIVIFVPTVILGLSLLKIVGVKWETVGYLLPDFMILTALLLITGAVLHDGLKIYGVRVSMAGVVATYAALVGAYSPVLLLMGYPSLVLVMDGLRGAKIQGFSFSPALVFAFKNQITAMNQGRPRLYGPH